MWLSQLHFQCLRSALIIAVVLCAGLPAQAQEAAAQDNAAQKAPPAQPKKPPKPYGGGSPLNVLLHTKLWETPPPAKDFVKASREPESDLHYQRTIGTDPKRPKLLSHDQLKSLEGELSQAGARNEHAAGMKNKDFANVDLRKAPKNKLRKHKAERSKVETPIALHTR